MVALQFAACTRNGKAVILIVIASNTHRKTIVWKLYGPLLEVKRILVFYNNCIFSYYEKKSGKTKDSDKIHIIQFGNLFHTTDL